MSNCKVSNTAKSNSPLISLNVSSLIIPLKHYTKQLYSPLLLNEFINGAALIVFASSKCSKK